MGPPFGPPKQIPPPPTPSKDSSLPNLSQALTLGYVLGPLGPVLARITLCHFSESPLTLKANQIPHLPPFNVGPPGLLSAGVLSGGFSQRPLTCDVSS